jgi:radical SAM superfamily enzyme YgiQ (UPF0313 family)
MQVVILTTNTVAERQARYLGPYQIAWWVRKNGYTSQVLDFLYFMTPAERLPLYKKFITTETKIVGYSPFSTMGGVSGQKGDIPIWQILEEIKEHFPWVKIVLGGPFTRKYIYGGWKNISFKVDAIFQNEGESSFLEYCNHIFKGDPIKPFKLLGNGLKIYDAGPLYDIQTSNMTFEENDFILPGESLPLELSRGCIFKCKFCQFPNIGKDKDDFNRSMDCIRETLITHYEQFGTTRYHITDDTINSHRVRTQAFYEMTKTLPFKLEYLGYLRMDLLDIWPEQVEILPASGLMSCHFGVESFDAEACKIIGKGWGAKNYKPWLTKLGEEWGDDVIITCSFIAGLAKETEVEWEATYQWMLDSKVHDWVFNVMYIDPYLGASDIDKNYEKYGYRLVNNQWENDYTNETKAKAWAQANKNASLDKKIPGAWNLSAALNMGFEREFILKSNYKELRELREKHGLMRKMTLAYLTKAMSY